MRIGIQADMLFKQRSGVGQYLHLLLTHLAKLETPHEYILAHSAPRSQNVPIDSYAPTMTYRHVPIPRGLLYAGTGLGRWSLPWHRQVLGDVDVYHWPNHLLVPGGRGRHVLTVCDLSFLLFPHFHQPWRSWALCRGIRHAVTIADKIIAISEHTGLALTTYLGVPKEKIQVIHCAAAPHFHPADHVQKSRVLARYRLPSAGFLLFVGNIEPRKNLPRLLEAYSGLRRHAQLRLPLVLCGGRGWRNAAIDRTIEREGLESYVLRIGYVPDADLPALISAATVFVYPSLYEGFGMPPIEAMACGTPVVASNVASLPEVVGDAAVLTDPYDIEGLASAMQQVLTRQDLRADLRIKGLRRAQSFSWQETARQTLKVYEEVAAR